MADFVAVIRRAVDGLSDDTPELRAKVYEKARGAVLRQLESMKPRPPEEMLRRQLEKLETAIREVEAEHAEAMPAEDAVAPAEDIAPESPAYEPEPVADAPAEGIADHEPSAEPVAESVPSPEPAPHYQEPVVAEPVAAPLSPEPVAVVETAPAAFAPEPEETPVAAPAPVIPAPVFPASPAAAPAAVAAPAVRAPALWDDESWADEGEVPAPASAPVQVAPVHVAPVHVPPTPEPEPFVDVAAPPVAPEPVLPQPVEEPVAAPEWDAPEPAVLAREEQAVADHGDFIVEDPTEKYAAMEPVAIAEPLAAAPVATEWPEGGVDVDANARIAADEWAAPAQYEPAADAGQPTLSEETGLPVSVSQPVTDPLAWAPDAPVAASAAAVAEPAPEPTAELSAPAQDYFDDAVHVARVEETAAAVAPERDIFTSAPIAPRPAAPQPADDWDLLGHDLPPLKTPAAPVPAAAEQNAWEDESPFDDVPLSDARGGNAAPARNDDQWNGFEDFEAYDAADKGRSAGEDEHDDLLFTNVDKPARSYRIEPKRRLDYTSIGLGLLGLVLVAGSGYGAWVFRDTLSGLVTGLVSSPPSETKPATEATKPAAGKTTDAKPATGDKAATNKPAGQETASAEPEIQKFTQRLQADGSEVDDGKASGAGAGEGKSVAEQTVASAEPANTAVPGAGTPATTTTPDATIPVGVSQKMYLYEERVGQTSPVAIEGAVAWSLKKVVGENGKTESVVQAQVSAPERNLSALITFKRNLDPSLPASHLVELVFSIPKDFEGGAIESVQRVALKQTEQDRGDPLIAVPAKITDDFHMIALNDYADARAFNLKLLETRDWIDIPVTYRNGRRALITMEKGATGSEAFKAAIRDWKAEEGPTAGAQ